MNIVKNGGQPVLLVTGGGKGIGAAVCRQGVAAGYRVVINYRTDKAAVQRLMGSMAATDATVTAVQGDVGEEADVIRMFDHAFNQFGRIDALVNNAGILEQQMPFADMSAERFDRILSTNVRGSMLCAREAIRRMARSRGGSGGVIVNVSSRAACLGAPGEYVDYAVSKGAIDTLTIGLAGEVGADGIRVNAVRPGVIETDIHASGGEPGRVARLAPSIPLGRGGTAEEVADAIMWLLSDQSSYCNGALIDVSGGR